MEDLFSFLTEISNSALRRLANSRFVIFLLTGLFAIGFYEFVVVYSYDTDLSIVDLISPYPDEVVFYAGNENGVYYEVFDKVREELKKEGINASLVPTAGGYENASKVFGQENSFGFCQKDAFGDKDFIINNVDFITPVYVEHFHVLYKPVNSIGRGNPVSIGSLSSKNKWGFYANTDTAILDVFRYPTSKVNTGKVGSGTKVISSYLLNEIYEQIKENAAKKEDRIMACEVGDLELKNALHRLGSKEIDMVFYYAGTTSSLIKDAIKNGGCQVMNIDPLVVNRLRKEYNLIDMRPTKMIYEIGDRDSSISTFGTFTYLVSQQGTSKKLTRKIIYALDKVVSDMGFDKSDISNFKSYFDAKYNTSMISGAKNIMVFLTSTVLASIPFYLFLVWIYSGFNYWGYLKQINRKINEKALPNNIIPKSRHDLRIMRYDFKDRALMDEVIHNNKQPDKMMRPFFVDNQLVLINRIMEGISFINYLRSDIDFKKYEKGALTESHYNFLMDRLDKYMIKLRRNLALRLYRVVTHPDKFPFWQSMVGNEKSKNEENSQVVIERLYVADYLTEDDYKMLSAAIKFTGSVEDGVVSVRIVNDNDKTI